MPEAEDPKPQIMTYKEYAAHRKISTPSLTGYVQRGILPEGAWIKTETNKYRFDVAKCDAILNSRTHANVASHQALISGGPEEPRNHQAETAVQFSKARSSKEVINAKLAHLDLQEREGTLVNAVEARKEGFELARNLREAIFNIPDRLSAILAAETDSKKVYDALHKEFRQAFEGIDKKFKPGSEPKE